MKYLRRHDAVSYFAGATVLSAVVAAAALRNNYQTMGKLRSAVFLADEQNGDVEAALQNLRSYVGTHMNTSLSSGNTGIYPPIQLKYRYERLVASRQAAVANNPVAAASLQPVPEDMYKYDFASPTWSPDVAGWSIVLTIVLTIVTLGLLARRIIKRHL